MQAAKQPQVNVDALIAEKLPSVEKIVHQTAMSFPAHVDREELYSAGCLGLVEAANRFDPSKGFSFSTWAEYRIRGAVLDYARSQDRLSQYNRKNAREYTLAVEELTIMLDRPPTTAEIGKKLQWAPTKIQDIKKFIEAGKTSHKPIEDHIALDEKVGVDGTLLSPEEHAENDEVILALRVSLSALNERQQQVIVGLYVEGLTTKDVAEKCNISLSRVAQIRNETLEILRDALGSHLFSDDNNVSDRTSEGALSQSGGFGDGARIAGDADVKKSKNYIRSRDAILSELKAARASRPQRPTPPRPSPHLS